MNSLAPIQSMSKISLHLDAFFKLNFLFNSLENAVPQNDYNIKKLTHSLFTSAASGVESSFNFSSSSQFQAKNDYRTRTKNYSNFILSSTAFKPTTANEIRLAIIRQPELQHRARYLSEGSRGAIKDRTGSSNCTIQLIGYHRPTRVQLIAVLGDYTSLNAVTLHPLYRLIPVSGKTSSCKKTTNAEGVECIEIMLYPENNMTAVLDCIGILKICTYDTKNRKRKASQSSISTGAGSAAAAAGQNTVRIFIRALIPTDMYGGLYTLIHAVTDPISCVQQLGVPEIYKMSRNNASARGGDELFIVGRNFDRNARILFREYREDGTLKWSAEAHIDKQYLHQCHIVCTLPPYINIRHGGEVSMTVICANKSSHPRSFLYIPCAVPELDDDWRPPSSPQIAINNSFYLADYEVENHNQFSLLERNCFSLSAYKGTSDESHSSSNRIAIKQQHHNLQSQRPSSSNYAYNQPQNQLIEEMVLLRDLCDVDHPNTDNSSGPSEPIDKTGIEEFVAHNNSEIISRESSLLKHPNNTLSCYSLLQNGPEQCQQHAQSNDHQQTLVQSNSQSIGISQLQVHSYSDHQQHYPNSNLTSSNVKTSFQNKTELSPVHNNHVYQANVMHFDTTSNISLVFNDTQQQPSQR